METFILSPYLIAYVGAALQTLLLIFKVWIPKNFEIPEGWQGSVYRFIRTLFRIFYGCCGILLVDIALFWLIGAWGYSDWKFQLPSVILGLIIGFRYFGEICLKNPKISTLLLTIGIICSIEYLVHFYLPSFSRIYKSIVDIAWIPLIAFVISLIFGVLQYHFIIRMKKKDWDVVLWDISSIFNKIFTNAWEIGFWVIFLAEAMLKFFGLSLFLW